MVGSKRNVAVLGALAVVAALFSPATQAVAGHNATLKVQVGQHFALGANCNPETFQGCRDGESMRFLAPNLRVHKGDTVQFDFAGFHTATLLPKNTDIFGWIQANTPGTTNPYSLFVPDADDTAREGGTTDRPSVKVNNRVQFPSDPSCGTPDNPCPTDGSAIVNSGVPQGDGDEPASFSAKINANPGEFIWVLCLLHPHMFVKVTVVDDAAAASTQADIDTFKTSALAGDLDWAQSQDARLINEQASHMTSSGQKVYDVNVGVDNHRVSLNAMYPRKTVIPKGATVRFHFDELIYEHHTATMSFQQGLQRGQEMFSPWCDPDGDAGSAPDVPAEFSAGPPCGGDFSKFEVDIPSELWNQSGDSSFTGDADFENSGFRGGLQFSLSSFDVKFKKVSNRKGWRYFCLVHGPGMSGRVRVKS